MSIQFPCANCNTTISSLPEHVGAKTLCPQCNQWNTAPAVPEPTSHVAWLDKNGPFGFALNILYIIGFLFCCYLISIVPFLFWIFPVVWCVVGYKRIKDFIQQRRTLPASNLGTVDAFVKSNKVWVGGVVFLLVIILWSVFKHDVKENSRTVEESQKRNFAILGSGQQVPKQESRVDAEEPRSSNKLDGRKLVASVNSVGEDGDSLNMAHNRCIRNLRATATVNSIILEFDLTKNQLSDQPHRFMARYFDEDGQYIGHFTTKEKFSTLVFDPRHGFRTLQATGNRLEYPVPRSKLKEVKSVEFGYTDMFDQMP